MKRYSIIEKLLFILIVLGIILNVFMLFADDKFRHKIWMYNCQSRVKLFGNLTSNYCMTIPEILNNK